MALCQPTYSVMWHHSPLGSCTQAMANFEGGICSVCATTIQEQTMRQDGHGPSKFEELEL